MMKIKINGRKCRLPTTWQEITLEQCAWLHNRVNQVSPELKEYYRMCASDDNQTCDQPQIEDNTEIMALESDVIAHLTGLTPRQMKMVCLEDIAALAELVVPKFVCGVLGYMGYQTSSCEWFWWRGRRYRYPSSGVDAMGMITPLSHLTAIELCQVSDIVRTNNMTLAPLAIAICCRPQGDSYDESKAQRRAKAFVSLPASVYWELWVRVAAAHHYLQESFSECYGKSASAKQDGHNANHGGMLWADQLVAMAIGNPSALTYLQGMNGYDFVHLMNENIKRKKETWEMEAALSGLKLF